MDKRINYQMVLDVETANGLDCPLVYDIGGVITDKQGHIYEKFSFIVREIFIAERDLMKSAYYAKKIPQYFEGIYNGERIVKNFSSIRYYIMDLMKKYSVNTVCAYNASFDIRALNNTTRWLSKSKYRYFFPYGTKIVCIWNMATQTICKQKGFSRFCEENKFFCNNEKNYSTTAETIYRYLYKNPEYEEEHKGFEDVLIETEIFTMCLRQHKAFYNGRGVRRNCWVEVKRV